MKSNTAKYLMLFIVIGIWGSVLYRFIAFRNSDSSDKFQASTIKLSQVSDTFSLKLGYSDPFKISSKSIKTDVSLKEISNRKIENEKKIIVKELKSDWPNIRYKGGVFNEKRQSNRVIIVVNGSLQVLNKGDVILGMSLVYVSKDSVGIKLNNQVKYFRLYEK
jgi:hypothetical protein